MFAGSPDGSSTLLIYSPPRGQTCPFHSGWREKGTVGRVGGPLGGHRYSDTEPSFEFCSAWHLLKVRHDGCVLLSPQLRLPPHQCHCCRDVFVQGWPGRMKRERWGASVCSTRLCTSHRDPWLRQSFLKLVHSVSSVGTTPKLPSPTLSLFFFLMTYKALHGCCSDSGTSPDYNISALPFLPERHTIVTLPALHSVSSLLSIPPSLKTLEFSQASLAWCAKTASCCTLTVVAVTGALCLVLSQPCRLSILRAPRWSEQISERPLFTHKVRVTTSLWWNQMLECWEEGLSGTF